MTTDTEFLIKYYQKQLDNAQSSYEIDFFRNAIESLRNGACPICHAGLPKTEPKITRLLGDSEIVVKKGKFVIKK